MLIDCQCYVLHIDLIQGYVNWSVLSGYKFLSHLSLNHETRDGVNSYEVQHLYKHPLRIPHTSYFSLTFLTFLKRVVLSTCFRLHDK